MKTIGRVDEVNRFVGEEPIIEGTRHACDETGPGVATILFLELLIEIRERLENGVEVISRKIIEENLECR